ncbi:hypothetical protein FRC03_002689 [Tulasnella sp. 419]|nr:hypothetical protein FRC03_002689 [Tulasnella sp. 419]
MESVGEITDLEGFFMLLRLARLSRDGGMGKETSQIYDSASQVCGRLTKKADPEMLYELAMLLYDIFANLAIRGYTEDAKTVLQEVKKVRRQLVKNGQETDVAKLAGYLDGISSKLKKIRCSEAAALAKHEARRCRANEKAGWAQGEKQVLSQLQMETLFQAPYSPKSFKRYSIA